MTEGKITSVEVATRHGGETSSNSSAEETIRGIGTRIRRLRRERRLTLSEMAERTGVSMSMLSMVERGQATPSIGTLVAVSTTLGLHMADLFAAPEHPAPSPVRRRDEQVAVEGPGGVTRRLAHDDHHKGLEMVVNEYPPGSSSSPTRTHHAGTEFGVVVRGRLSVDLDGAEHVLETGDAISYVSATPHRISNPGRTVAVAVWLNMSAPQR